jgi:hypothetical protein
MATDVKQEGRTGVVVVVVVVVEKCPATATATGTSTATTTLRRTAKRDSELWNGEVQPALRDVAALVAELRSLA